MNLSKQGISLTHFQGLISKIYSEPNDRLFSLSDILSNIERFTMRALKGIRKDNKQKLKTNLLIALSWTMALANRLHFDVEANLWRRFPYACPYCGGRPCNCGVTKPTSMARVRREPSKRPGTIEGLQQMLEDIYPSAGRDLWQAGVHLAEETGEVSEAVRNFRGLHKEKQFLEICDETADWVSCLLGVANSAGINVGGELSKMFKDGCHVCHNAPCTCKFSFVASYKS